MKLFFFPPFWEWEVSVFLSPCGILLKIVCTFLFCLRFHLELHLMQISFPCVSHLVALQSSFLSWVGLSSSAKHCSADLLEMLWQSSQVPWDSTVCPVGTCPLSFIPRVHIWIPFGHRGGPECRVVTVEGNLPCWALESRIGTWWLCELKNAENKQHFFHEAASCSLLVLCI